MFSELVISLLPNEDKFHNHLLVIVISLPGVWSYTFVPGVAWCKCVRPHPREGYVTCYLGNITVEEGYEQYSYTYIDDYCLHSQVDPCLFCMNTCTLMTLYGSKVLEFCEARYGFLIQCNYWKLCIHCLTLPGFNVYTSRDLRPLPPSRKKQSVLPWIECQDHHLTNHWDEHACVHMVYTC